MKRKELVLWAAAALTLGSCTQQGVDEIAPQQKASIEFSTYVERATRAEDVTTQNLNMFYVYGGKMNEDGSSIDEMVFDHVAVSKSGDAWTYNGNKYWEDGKTYWFAATNSATHDPKFEDGSLSNDYCEFVLDYDIPDYDYDLIAAIPKSYSYSYRGNAPMVSFAFKHLMAKVMFTFENEFEADYDVEIEYIVLEKIKDRGKVHLYSDGNIDWNLTNTGTCSYSDNIKYSDSETVKQTEAKFVCPQFIGQDVTLGCLVRPSAEYEPYYLTIKIPTETVDQWEAGKVYNYTLKIKPGKIIDDQPIEFTVSGVESWEDSTGTDLGEAEVDIQENV